jgi:catechol 2,3-dioxygenase-like lactoylglutathione lyase family enzyme
VPRRTLEFTSAQPALGSARTRFIATLRLTPRVAATIHTAALHIKMGEGDNQEDILHTFFQFDDGSCIAFFDAPSRPFDWQEQMDLDLHIAFEVDTDERLQDYLRAAKERGIEVRGPSDHGFVHSIYIRDPNGYVFELTHVLDPDAMAKSAPDAHSALKGFMNVTGGQRGKL